MRRNGLVWMLNRLFNSNHNWFDYKDESPLSALVNVAESITNKYTGAHLTGAENEANAFSAEEAQKSRDFTEYMARNKYQMETQSMEQAGLNPAMVYGGGQLVPTATNGAAATSAQPQSGELFDVISTFARLPAELKVLESEAKRNRMEGMASIITANANQQNAGTNQQNAATNSRMADIQDKKVQIERELADANIAWTNEDKERVSAVAALALEQKEYISKNYEVALKNANSNQKQALAALKNAEAAVQNAATNDYKATYETSLMWSQEMLAYAEGEGREIVNKYLDARQKEELENIKKQGLYLDSERRLRDKQGNLATAQMVREYVGAACDVGNTVSRFVGIGALSNAAGATRPTPVSPDMLYGNYGTFYE